MTLTAKQKARIDSYGLVPRHDNVVRALRKIIADKDLDERFDYELANLMAERLRFTYSELQEVIYPELLAANGGVLPIDSSPSPEAESWRYHRIDYAGKASWISEDGRMMASSAVATREFTGVFGRFGHQWDTTIFDLARAAESGFSLMSWKVKAAKRAHDEFKNWVRLFGDPAHQLLGLCNHPNITKMLSPANGTGSSRLWSAKSDDNILADILSIVFKVRNDTLNAEQVAKMYFPESLIQLMMSRYISATASGTVTLLDKVRAALAGDPTTGQGKVDIRIMNECDSTRRIDPKTVTISMDGTAGGGSDTSGISGDFILACPADDVSKNAFVQAYPMKQESPKEVPDTFQVITKTHERTGGAIIRTPKAFVMFRFA